MCVVLTASASARPDRSEALAALSRRSREAPPLEELRSLLAPRTVCAWGSARKCPLKVGGGGNKHFKKQQTVVTLPGGVGGRNGCYPFGLNNRSRIRHRMYHNIPYHIVHYIIHMYIIILYKVKYVHNHAFANLNEAPVALVERRPK